MRQLSRWLFNIGAAVSLVLLVPCAIVMLRGHLTSGQFTIEGRQLLVLFDGRIGRVYWMRNENGLFLRTATPEKKIDIWMILSVLAIMPAAKAIVLHRKWRRKPPGHCQKCGYNLTGNVSGICPECGTAVQTEVRSRRSEVSEKQKAG